MPSRPLVLLQDDGERTALPLYTEAVKFFNHRDGMVRAAVRTLTLQMYALESENIQQFLVSQPASNFFNEVAIIIAEHCQVCLPSLKATLPVMLYKAEWHQLASLFMKGPPALFH